SEPETEAVRPFAAVGKRFERYSRAIRDVDAPTLFENRLSYRLLEVEPGAKTLRFGLTTYFDMVDVCEAVAHELAAPWLRDTPAPDRTVSQLWSELPFRRLIGDVFDLTRRPVLPSISILTIRRSASSAAFILHDRDPARVAVAGGMFQVMPSGVFQPSSISPLDLQHDFDLWHNILREFSEEYLGNPEHDGSAVRPIDYEASEPFRSLSKARREGKLRIYFFGIGMDPLTLAGEIIGVAVIDDDVFESVFEAFVDRNAEGIAVAAGSEARAADGIPFTRPSIDRLRDGAVMAPAGSACLELAWRSRALLLDG
ncbi:MAG: helix-turn-helix domain-containing protein, partial [Gaiellaceae bacterium]